jgi:hypothetical protein
MNAKEIGSKINAMYLNVYVSMSQPTELIMVNGSTKVGYFGPVDDSHKLVHKWLGRGEKMKILKTVVFSEPRAAMTGVFRNFLLVFLCLNALTCLAQKGTNKKAGDSVIAKLTQKQGEDTSHVFIDDTLVLPSVSSSTPNFKVIVSKADEKPDRFKYIFPILTLLLGIIINKGLDHLFSRKKTKKEARRWAAEIIALENPIKRQIAALKDFLAEHQKNTWDYPPLQIFTSLDGEVFKSLDKSELLKYLELYRLTFQDAVNVSNEINGFISVLSNHHSVLKGKWEEYSTERSKHTTALNENIQGLLSAFASYQVSLEKELHADPVDDPRFRPILDLMNEHIWPHLETGAFDPFHLKEAFFTPLTVILANFRHDERVQTMATFTASCLSSIKQINMEKYYLNKNVATIIERYQNDLAELPDIIKQINS